MKKKQAAGNTVKDDNSVLPTSGCPFHLGNGGELHQTSDEHEKLTTNQGVVISDNQNSLKSSVRGPTLLEDFILREKITHFDHERIPERIVHARGSGAHGVFESYGDFSDVTMASFLQAEGKQTEVFTRFSTVAGGAGSADLPRDVRGFSVKFYTETGNYDFVGNNIPVFFIQDAIKFPDLIHAVKMEADRAFPQAASAHDTFWDFASLMPESMHMLMWAMSDRTIPRSLRMIEGFGVNTYRFVNKEGVARFVKFHWRPMLGAASVVWDEAIKINGADSDYHRRDLWNSIEGGSFPEWEFSVQLIDQETADNLEFDILDPTKVIPEEIVPLTKLGKMTLNRNPDNFFAETEQVAFHPGHVVPGIDFSNDPLLQGRLHSYLDTQLSRLGGPNFHQIPINRARCPVMNFQRDGLHQMGVPKGRANYEPNSIDLGSPRENSTLGFNSFPEVETGEKGRIRPESFADHYSQARMFYESMSEPENFHIVKAFVFELSKVAIIAIRTRMLGHLSIISTDLCSKVEEGLGMVGMADAIEPRMPVVDLEPSPTLSIINKAPISIKGRVIGILVTNGCDGKLVDKLQELITLEEASCNLIAPKIGGVTTAQGKKLSVHHTISGGPSVLFDAVALFIGDGQGDTLAREACAVDWVKDAFGHLKVIGCTEQTDPLLKAAGVEEDKGVITFVDEKDLAKWIETAKKGRIWDREPKLRSLG